MLKDYMNMPIPVEQDRIYDFIRRLTFSVNSFGRWHQTDTRTLTNYTIMDFEIAYIEAGTLNFTCNHTPMTVKTGDLLLMTPFQVYNVECISKEPVSYYYIHFDLERSFESAPFIKLIMPNQHNVCSGANFPNLLSIFEDMYQDLITQQEGRALTIYTILIQLLSYVIKEKQTMRYLSQDLVPQTQIDNRSLQLVNAGINFMKDNLEKPLKINDVAKYLGVSNSLLYKSFISVMNTSPNRFLLTFKINEAEKLLKLQDMSMAQIADSLGFSSAYHFSKTFKSLTGISPQTYKNKMFGKQSAVN